MTIDHDWQMLDDINKIIFQVNYKELNSIAKMIKNRREVLNKIQINKFNINDKVEFSNNGEMIQGTIQKVNIKRVKVLTDNGRWDIPASMLEFVQ
tara:strand:- start:100 stop:384 length:285 start_codon:yes stop_codon:yes gene_type:complete